MGRTEGPHARGDSWTWTPEPWTCCAPHRARRVVGAIDGSDLVFGVHPEYLSDRFDAAVKVSALPRLRFHDTRHTAVSLMLAAGVPVTDVAARVGHASPTITLSVYSHALPGSGKAAAEALASAIA